MPPENPSSGKVKYPLEYIELRHWVGRVLRILRIPYPALHKPAIYQETVAD